MPNSLGVDVVVVEEQEMEVVKTTVEVAVVVYTVLDEVEMVTVVMAMVTVVMAMVTGEVEMVTLWVATVMQELAKAIETVAQGAVAWPVEDQGVATATNPMPTEGLVSAVEKATVDEDPVADMVASLVVGAAKVGVEMS